MEAPDAYRFKVVLMGISDGLYLSQATILHHLKYDKEGSEDENGKAAAQIIEDHMYIDGILTLFATIKDSIAAKIFLFQILNEMGMRVTTFASNNIYTITPYEKNRVTDSLSL